VKLGDDHTLLGLVSQHLHKTHEIDFIEAVKEANSIFKGCSLNAIDLKKVETKFNNEILHLKENFDRYYAIIDETNEDTEKEKYAKSRTYNSANPDGEDNFVIVYGDKKAEFDQKVKDIKKALEK
jgi:hypothetical protein